MKRLLISGIDGKMGRAVAALAGEYGFDPAPFSPEGEGTAVVDFSHPDCLPALLRSPLPLVIGTTGYSATQWELIARAARTRPVFQTANFSAGIYALQRLACEARRLLPGWRISLIERHHAEKQDAPSGTARTLAKALELRAEDVLSVRAGTVRGVHELTFYGAEETLTLTHRAESRDAFARGALRAARWLEGKPNGIYDMKDLLR